MQTYTAYLVVGLQAKDTKLSPMYLRCKASRKALGKKAISFEDWIDYIGDNEYYEFNSGQLKKEERVHGYIITCKAGVNVVDFVAELTATVSRFRFAFGLEPKVLTVLHFTEDN